jgi:hypothetical protein
LSDDLPRRGLPFQCLVPWGNLVVRIGEQCFMEDANRALAEAGNLQIAELKPMWEAMRRCVVGGVVHT